MSLRLETREFTHFHFFCGIGMGAAGFNEGTARLGNLEAQMRCIGGIDVDKDAIANFDRFAGVKGTCMDLFTLEQYIAFHGKAPPPGWREATPADIQRAAGFERPDIVFLSAPCKGFSGLLSQTTSLTDKYQALNELTLRGVWLMLETWKNDPPGLIIFENVPRIRTRGRRLLDLIQALFRSYGYQYAETEHDCGEIGNLAQSRKRFLMVARHPEKVPPFLYQPPKHKLRGVGEVLDLMPLPGDPAGGPMHRIPSLQWKTWVRLAFVEAGSDWRSLNKLNVEDGYLKDFLIVPEYRAGYLGVNTWGDPMGTVAGRSTPSNGAFSVADMRPPANAEQYSQYGVLRYEDTAGVVTSARSPGQGNFSVADIRHTGPAKHSNEFRIVPYSANTGAISSAHGSGQCVQDPRPAQREDYKQTKYRVTAMDEAAGTVIAASTTGNGAFAVADPRPNGMTQDRDHYNSQRHYGVLAYTDTSLAVPGFACHDNGAWSVADHRPTVLDVENPIIMPAAADRLTCVITAQDGTWHRPFTTLELAALQSLIDLDHPDSWWLHGSSDSQWREQIGNGVPRLSAKAMGSCFAMTLLLASAGETFLLSNTPIWVRPLAVSLAVDTSQVPA
ncbi:DNA methyltransferase [Asticcacaulis sp. AC460]|uniref:DNA cytosine methyltransferase n=1 Tax=Asticcacaulis sp. AC460 TaxID=1282360 RepID=UPI0003C40C7A|nr:DNA cytosine methyltransferase [Asticcacaulis sp. AC460]ESQ89979.1 DNA methyltransferase [Asticcacaulis sp. AC460]